MTSRLVLAQGDVQLKYSAPDTCPSTNDFQDDVAARIGKSPFVERAQEIVRVTIVQEESEYKDVLAMADGKRQSKGASCSVVVENLATVLSVMLSEDAASDSVSQGALKGGSVDESPLSRDPKVVSLLSERLTLKRQKLSLLGPVLMTGIGFTLTAGLGIGGAIALAAPHIGAVLVGVLLLIGAGLFAVLMIVGIVWWISRAAQRGRKERCLKAIDAELTKLQTGAIETSFPQAYTQKVTLLHF